MTRSRAGHHYIDATCIGCGACEYACPGKVDAIWRVEGDFLGRFVIVADTCIDCGFCRPMCPVCAVHDARIADKKTASTGGHTRTRSLREWAAARSA